MELILVLGENGSGKSLFAEELACKFGGRKIYLATMRPVTEDNRARIEKHRRQREGKGFVTVEAAEDICCVELDNSCTVLLEDVSNLLSNRFFSPRHDGAEAVMRDILSVSARCRALIAVSISGLHDEDYTGETADYIRALEQLNSMLKEQASMVYIMSRGAVTEQIQHHSICIEH